MVFSVVTLCLGRVARYSSTRLRLRMNIASFVQSICYCPGFVMTSALKTSILDLLSPVLKSEGIEVVDVEILGDEHVDALRFLIHKPGGTTIKDCQNVTRVVQPILEVHGIIESDTTLEVASPGLDRPLVTESDFRRNLGQNIQIEVVSPTGESMQLSGSVTNVEAGKVLLAGSGGETTEVEISTITKAQIQLMW